MTVETRPAQPSIDAFPVPRSLCPLSQHRGQSLPSVVGPQIPRQVSKDNSRSIHVRTVAGSEDRRCTGRGYR